MFFYIVLTPISTTSGLWSTGNTRKYHQIDVYIYQCDHSIWTWVRCILFFMFIFLLYADNIAINFFQKIFQEYHQCQLNSLDPYKARHYVGPYLGPNCLQRLWADSTSKQSVKFLLNHVLGWTSTKQSSSRTMQYVPLLRLKPRTYALISLQALIKW